MADHYKDWDDKLDSALWSFWTAFKVSTGMTPFQLVYGIEAVVPMEFVVLTLRISSEYRLSPEESLKHRQEQLL